MTQVLRTLTHINHSNFICNLQNTEIFRVNMLSLNKNTIYFLTKVNLTYDIK